MSADLPALFADLLHGRNFFLAPRSRLEIEYRPAVLVPWEVFCGRLLPPAQTRQRLLVDAWDVFLSNDEGRSTEPILSLKLDRQAGRLHVTRALECWVWEPYDAGANVILSREVRKWVPELIGSIALADFAESEELRNEVRVHLFQAIVGSSRLPLTSSEAPLPAFTLGRLGYVPQPPESPHPLQSPADLLAHGLGGGRTELEEVKLLELVLRAAAASEVERTAALLINGWSRLGREVRALLARFRRVFHEVALSPYTDFADKTLAVLKTCMEKGYFAPADYADFLGFLLRQLGRHLTAYDLITFHHRGANYPDALLLDATLKQYLSLIDHHPELFLGDMKEHYLRRRALRQGWLLRRQYEGLPIPAHPTSPGENARVLPPPFVRVPEEEVLDPARRTHRLYADDPLEPRLGSHARQVLQAGIADLEQPGELHELGKALFLDRPFGVFKTPGEPDQTLLLAHEAFSQFVAERRLTYLAEVLTLFPSPAAYEAARARLRANLPRGQSLPSGPRWQRPGVVSLRDADRAAPDFVFLHTTRQAVQALLEEFDFTALTTDLCRDWLRSGQRLLILSDPATQPGLLRFFDAQGVQRLELQVDPRTGYRRRGGREVPSLLPPQRP